MKFRLLLILGFITFYTSVFADVPKKFAAGINSYNIQDYHTAIVDFFSISPSNEFEEQLRLLWIAKTHFCLGNYSLAASALDNSSAPPKTLYSLSYLKMDSYQLAINIAQAAQTEFRYNDTIVYVLAEANYYLKNYDDALLFYYMLESDKRTKFSYQKKLAYTEYEYGNYFNAIEHLESQLYVKPIDYELYNYLGGCYYKIRNYKKAIEYFKIGMAKQHALSSVMATNLGYLYTEINEPDSAIMALKYAIKTDSTQLEAYYMLGDIYYGRKNFEESSVYYQKLININPKYKNAYEKLANSYYYVNNLDAAIEKYRQSSFFNEDPNYYNLIGLCYLQMNESSKAIANFEQALKIQPSYAISYYNLAAVYYNLRQYDMAISYCAYALQYIPNDEDLNFLFARIYTQMAMIPEAEHYFQETLRLNPIKANVYLYLADLALIQNKKMSAKFYYSMYNVLVQNDAEGLYYQGVTEYNLKEYKEAITHLTKSNQLKKDEKTLLALSKTYYKLEDFHSAVKVANELVSAFPSNAKAYLTLSLAYKKLGNNNESKYYEKLAYIYDPEIEKYIF